MASEVYDAVLICTGAANSPYFPDIDGMYTDYKGWILRARDRDRDMLARLRFGHQRPLNRRCPDELGHQRPVNRGCPWVSKPVSQDIQSICYCLHTGIFHLDTCDLVVAGVRISISPKYLYLYLALKVLTYKGQITHMHSYRTHYEFKDKTVLVVGNQNSAGDAAADISHAAKQVQGGHFII